MYEHDTIAAIATPLGQGGIAIIRVSGSGAEAILRELFIPYTSWEQFHSHHFYLGKILNQPNGQPVDQAGLIFMRAPHSYTGEDVAELHIHGGNFLTQRVLESVLNSDVRLAQPGEFTKRAFLNGRLDLAQAEAVQDLIQANNKKGVHMAWEDLSGRLSNACLSLRDRLISQTAHLEAFVDFPEEDIPQKSRQDITLALADIRKDIEALSATFAQGKVYREGVRTAIIGKPNVGKSSVLNLLAGTDRAIVTKIPGTTRDVIEETVLVEGIPLVLWDTAGIRHTTDEVEQRGIERTLHGIEKAELLLVLFDLSEPFDADDAIMCEKIKGKNFVLVGNKSDLPQKFDPTPLVEHLHEEKLLHISALCSIGVEVLGQKIREAVIGEEIDGASQDTYNVYSDLLITNIRHKNALDKAAISLTLTEKGLAEDVPIDLVAVDLRSSLDHIGEITGHVSSEDILDRVFQDFCIGK